MGLESAGTQRQRSAKWWVYASGLGIAVAASLRLVVAVSNGSQDGFPLAEVLLLSLGLAAVFIIVVWTVVRDLFQRVTRVATRAFPDAVVFAIEVQENDLALIRRLGYEAGLNPIKPNAIVIEPHSLTWWGGVIHVREVGRIDFDTPLEFQLGTYAYGVGTATGIIARATVAGESVQLPLIVGLGRVLPVPPSRDDLERIVAELSALR